MFSKQTYALRRSELRRLLRENGQSGIAVLIGNAEAPRNYYGNTYHMRQDSTFLYYFGLDRHDLAAIIDIDADSDTLYGNDYTVDDFIWMGPQSSVAEQGLTVGVENAKDFAALASDVKKATSQTRKVHYLPPYRAHNRQIVASMLSIPFDDVVNHISTPLIEAVVAQREIKTIEEIAQIDEACNIGNMMHRTAMKMCRPGVTEREVAGQIEGIALKYGKGVSFHSIVSQNGETLHNHSHDGILTDGRLFLVDSGAENVMNYCSDFTRTMPVNGKFSSRQRDIYQIVYNAIITGQQKSKPGITNQSVQIDVAMGMVDGLKAIGLLKGNTEDAVMVGAQALLMPHGLGHQLGLDVHDMEDLGEKFVGYNKSVQRSTIPGLASLRMGKELKVGHVLTVEPGIYFIPALVDKWQSEGKCAEFINFDKVREYFGFGGCRLENDILITEGGCRELGDERPPLQIDEVESFINS